jgi:hypothetical protein
MMGSYYLNRYGGGESRVRLERTIHCYIYGCTCFVIVKFLNLIDIIVAILTLPGL